MHASHTYFFQLSNEGHTRQITQSVEKKEIKHAVHIDASQGYEVLLINIQTTIRSSVIHVCSFLFVIIL